MRVLSCLLLTGAALLVSAGTGCMRAQRNPAIEMDPEIKKAIEASLAGFQAGNMDVAMQGFSESFEDGLGATKKDIRRYGELALQHGGPVRCGLGPSVVTASGPVAQGTISIWLAPASTPPSPADRDNLLRFRIRLAREDGVWRSTSLDLTSNDTANKPLPRAQTAVP